MRFARASLKPLAPLLDEQAPQALSRAFCAGLIEATTAPSRTCSSRPGYPVRFARASLKPDLSGGRHGRQGVIPCVLRGPH